MILVDTSVIVAWLDQTHPYHLLCKSALVDWASRDTLGISSVTFAELAAGGRTREAVETDLEGFERVELDFESSWRAGVAFRRSPSGKAPGKAVLPDFFIRAQAATHGWKHLTNDKRRVATFPEVEFLFPDISLK